MAANILQQLPAGERVGIAFSGGLDTSYLVPKLSETPGGTRWPGPAAASPGTWRKPRERGSGEPSTGRNSSSVAPWTRAPMQSSSNGDGPWWKCA